jgi:hypothetical protein
MLAIKVVCPHCSKRLKTSKPPTVGHRVLCSRCGRSFAVPPNPSAPTPQPPTLSPPSPRHHAAHVEIAPQEEHGPQPASHRRTFAIGLVLGGLLLLMGTTIGLVVYFATRPEPEMAQAPASPSPQSAEESAASSDLSPADSELLPTDLPDTPPPPVARKEPKPRPNDPPPLAPPSAEPKSDSIAWLPAKEQENVNKAIDIGVQWLKNAQSGDGHWGSGYPVGLSALPALTLLECGVPADDSHIQKAVRRVRAALPRLDSTYELALAVLFLDRLGDPEDAKWIRTCAVRLVVGQAPSGGWRYKCPSPIPITPKQADDLLAVMRLTRPKTGLDLFVGGPNGSSPPGFITRGPGAPLDKRPRGGKPMEKPSPDAGAYMQALRHVPPILRQFPALQPPEQSHRLLPRDDTDNSNTQFATLALSAAARHDLPLERSLALIAVRFHKSQTPSGGWNYRFSAPAHEEDVRPAMVGSGLLGLAVGLGLAADHAQPGAAPRPIDDRSIEKGFDYLSARIGDPLSDSDAQINMYTLWTIERCGVLYNRRQIGGKDWYPWGVKLLLKSQGGDGSWNHGHYYAPGNITPITDTCFALLFLKRANLAKDLTKKLEFFMEGKKLQEP